MMEKRQVVLKNGEVIHYLEQGQGDKTLVLIHGNFSSSLYYLPLLERLPKDIHVVAPDLRGYGDSTYYRRIESLEDFADDIKKFMDETHRKSRYSRLVAWWWSCLGVCSKIPGNGRKINTNQLYNSQRISSI